MGACIYCGGETGGSMASCSPCRTRLEAKRKNAPDALRIRNQTQSMGFQFNTPLLVAVIFGITAFSIYALGFASFGPGWGLPPVTRAYNRCVSKLSPIQAEFKGKMNSIKTGDPVGDAFGQALGQTFGQMFGQMGTAFCEKGKQQCVSEPGGSDCYNFLGLFERA